MPSLLLQCSIMASKIVREEDGPPDKHVPVYTVALEAEYEGKPTEEEAATLRRVPGKLPAVAYLLCFVEFCERASYFGQLGSHILRRFGR